jgi:hypothetical protein
VCAGWRELAHSTPKLWSSLSIHLSEANVKGEEYWECYQLPQHFVDQVNLPLLMHLELSEQAPLDIEVAITPEPHLDPFENPDFPTENTLPSVTFHLSGPLYKLGKCVLEELIPHAVRWRDVDFTPAYVGLLSSVKGRLPLLRNVKFGRYTKGYPTSSKIHPIYES